MKQAYFMAVLTLASSAAMAAPTPASVPPGHKDNRIDVQFDCNFRARDKKGVSCSVEGEVTVRFLDGDITTSDRRDNGRDDNRLRVLCTDGYRQNERAIARLIFDHDRRDDATELDSRERSVDLLIQAIDRDWTEGRRDKGDRVLIEDILRSPEQVLETTDRRDGDHEDFFRAKFTRDNSGDNFFGRCRLRVEHDHGPRS